MDIAKLSAETQSIEIVHPGTGEEIGLSIELRSPHSDEVKAVINKGRQSAQRARNKSLSIEKLEALNNDILVASVASWDWRDDCVFDGEKPDNTDKWKRRVLENSAAAFIVNQINEALSDEAGFIKG